jgi:hypothetical protein
MSRITTRVRRNVRKTIDHLQVEDAKEHTFCDRCRILFNSQTTKTSNEKYRREGVGPRFPYDCISRLKTQTECRLCALVLQRLGRPLPCKCTKPSDTCISLQQLYYSQHDFEWRIYYGGVPKGLILRNSKEKLKGINRDPVCVTLV